MWRKILLTVSAIIAVIALIATVTLSAFAASFNKGNYYILDEELFNKAREGKNTVYYAYDDGELVEVFNNSSIIGQDWISLEDVGDYLVKGFISAEDREFYKHHGINVKRTIGAMVNYFFHITSSFGASTITQQVVKNISGNNELSATRKFNEIMRALHLERLYSKEEILEVYLNIVPMSGNIYGVLLASEVYFDKKPSELTLPEAATIVGITNSPGRYDPYKNPEECREKRNRVLYAMLDNGVIEQEEYEKVIATELGVVEKKADTKIYSWFVETANRDIAEDLAVKKGISKNAAKLLLRGCKIILTENPKIQKILDDYFSDPANFSEQIKEGLNYSMVITDNTTGNLVGIVGGVGEKNGNNLLNLAEISVPPASTLKPLAIYAPMLEEKAINWSTIIDDTPISVSDANGGSTIGYPVNSPNVYSGLITVSDAVRLSKNTVAVKLLEQYGYERCASGLSSRYGFDLITTPITVDERRVSDLGIAPLALGQLSRGVSIRGLTEAYTAFAREGRYKKACSYIGAFDFNGNVLITPDVSEKQIYSAQTCRIMTQMLMNVVDSGTAKSITLKNLVDTAGKTGTSSGNYDRLFVGYTPYYTAGIWSGYPTRESAVSGVSPSHLAIWDDVMHEIHSVCAWNNHGEVTGFSTRGLSYSPYCLDSGLRYTDVCSCDLRGERVGYGYFSSNNAPTDECDKHRFLDRCGEYLVSAPMIERVTHENIFVVDDEFNYFNLESAVGFDNDE